MSGAWEGGQGGRDRCGVISSQLVVKITRAKEFIQRGSVGRGKKGVE